MRKLLGISLICTGLLQGALGTPLHADEYYSDDIFTAIAEAKERTHHYDYSNTLRYNRSTSQSIQIPRLLIKEMEQTSIETPELSAIEGQGSAIQADNSPLANATTEQRPNLPTNTGTLNLGNQSGVSMRAYISQ